MQYNGTTWNPATLGVVYRMAINYDYLASADSTGFNTMEVTIEDCPCVLDMVPVHIQRGVFKTEDKLTIWSVYFENPRDSTQITVGQFVYPGHFTTYTMGYMILSTDINTGKPYWGTGMYGGPPGKVNVPNYPIFRCLKY